MALSNEIKMGIVAGAFALVASYYGVPAIVEAVKRVNDAHAEEVGGKPNLFQQWIQNAPDFDKEPTFAGFLKKHGPTLVAPRNEVK